MSMVVYIKGTSVHSSTLIVNRHKMVNYRTRKFKSKGALMILMWTFTSLAVLSYPLSSSDNYVVAYFAASIITLPIAGVLADICFSRYKVIRCCLILLFASTAAYIFLLAIKLYLRVLFFEIMQGAAVLALSIAFSGISANMFSLGIDQLVDASSSEITSYISWAYWTFYFAAFVIQLLRINKVHDIYVLGSLILPVLSAVSVIIDFLCNHYLVKEPVSKNFFKLIYLVLRYAVKNKYPRMRSAFTFWEDKAYSRIDLGKRKYGGPFTTEQVEDVKTFFRILLVTVTFSLATLTVAMRVVTFKNEMLHFQDKRFIFYSDETSTAASKFERFIILHSQIFFTIIGVPIMELLIYPVLVKFNLDDVRTFKKMVLGLFIIIIENIFYLSSELLGLYQKESGNMTCVLHVKDNDLTKIVVIPIDYKWLLIPQILSAVAAYILYTGFSEFIISQSPYSIRGLLYGIAIYAGYIPFLLSLLFQHYLSRPISNNNKYCSLWFQVGLTFVTILEMGILLMVMKWYVPRRRDEDIHNRQVFVEEYYDKYLEDKTTSTPDS